MKNNIAEIRRSQRIKQVELANKLNITINYLSTLENKEKINGITLHRISKALNTTEHRIFDFSDRKRTKPNYNPHLEAFWAQGRQAREHLDEANRTIFINRILCSLEKEPSESVAPIRDIMYLGLYDVYCLLDYVNDDDTTESLSDMELMFAVGLSGAEYYTGAAILDKRIDIIQSFLNGLTNKKETRGGKNEINNLKIIREQSGLAQTELARISNVPYMTIRIIEDKRYCTDAYLKPAKKIAKALGCEFTDLFSKTKKDIYNIHAKKAGETYRKKYNTIELQNALLRDKERIDICVKDIIDFIIKTQNND